MQTRLHDKYKESLVNGMKKINNNPGTAVGFHSVLDGFFKLDESKLNNLVRAARIDETIFQEGLPQEIHSVRDFFKGLLFSLEKGKALQLMIRSEDTFRWLKENSEYDELRLGGTSANMAAILSQIGLPKVIVYANPLTKELAELFPDNNNLYVFGEEKSRAILRHPKDAWKEEGLFAVHWIFDFPAGLKVNVGNHAFTTTRANRFIAAWNPINNKLQLDPIFKKGVLDNAKQISHFLLSGYHILSENYPDGSDYRDYIQPTLGFIEELKAANRDIKIHLEFASISSTAIRKYLVKKLLPRVDSVGINEIELAALMSDLNEDRIAASIMNNNIEGFFDGADKIMQKTGIKRFHGHNLGYYLLISQPEYADKEAARAALLFAATVAAARTKDGYLTQDNWQHGLQVPIREEDTKEIDKLGKYLLANGFKKADDLIWENERVYVVATPSRVVDNPVLTVGLGDTISASAFLTS